MRANGIVLIYILLCGTVVSSLRNDDDDQHGLVAGPVDAGKLAKAQEGHDVPAAVALHEARGGKQPEAAPAGKYSQQFMINMGIGFVVCLLLGYFLSISVAFIGLWIGAALLYYKSEGIDTLSALYAAVQIITTVGYGDVLPKTDEGKITIACLIMVSTLVISAFVSELVCIVLERQESAMKSFMAGTKLAMKARDGEPGGLKKRPPKPLGLFNLFCSMVLFGLAVFAGAYYYSVYESCTCGFGFWQIADCIEGPKCAETGGAVKTKVDAFYMSVMTLSTVGFGDMNALSRQGRAFACCWMLLGVGMTVNLVTAFGNVLQNCRQRQKEDAMPAELFDKYDTGKKGKLDKLQFLQLQLEMNSLVDPAVVEDIFAQFDIIDTSRDGTVDVKEVRDYYG